MSNTHSDKFLVSLALLLVLLATQNPGATNNFYWIGATATSALGLHIQADRNRIMSAFFLGMLVTCIFQIMGAVLYRLLHP